MREFLNDNKEWIYLNKENDIFLNLLVILIEQIDPFYFENEEKEKQKCYGL